VQSVEVAEAARDEALAQLAAAEDAKAKLGQQLEKWKVKHKACEAKLKVAKGELKGLRQHVAAAPAALERVRKEGEKASKAKEKQSGALLESAREHVLQKAMMIEALKREHAEYASVLEVWQDRAEKAEARVKSLGKDVARKDKAEKELRHAEKEARKTGEMQLAEQAALTDKVAELNARSTRKDGLARVLREKTESTMSELEALRQQLSEEVAGGVAVRCHLSSAVPLCLARVQFCCTQTRALALQAAVADMESKQRELAARAKQDLR
jgi:chromosome segregation ATPase